MWKSKSNELDVKGNYLIIEWTVPLKFKPMLESRPAVRESSATGICVPNKVEICAEAQSHTTLACDWVYQPSAVPLELIDSALKIYKYLHDWIQTHEYISQTGFLESYFTSWRLPLAALREKKRSSLTYADKKSWWLNKWLLVSVTFAECPWTHKK